MTDTSAHERIRAATAAMWEQVHRTQLQRISAIESAVITLLEGHLAEDKRAAAEREAHKIAGSAGTFGMHRASEIARELEVLLAGRTVTGVRRRGKYLWLELDAAAEGDDAVLAHLGMSGQMLVADPARPAEKHLRIRFGFADDGPELRFVDQRTFGGMSVHPLVPAAGPGQSSPGQSSPEQSDRELLPKPIAHIARDPMDPAFELDAAVAGLRRRRTGLKRALLDQTVVSGIGNIYADEALWRARLHYERPTDRLTRAHGRAVLTAATEVMTEALAAGGTSFDALYVDVNGASGYFDRSLAVYGQADRPCRRCGTPIRRDPFMNRSSYWCPRCQPRPRQVGVKGSRGV